MKNTKLPQRIRHGRRQMAMRPIRRKPLALDEVETAFKNEAQFPPLLSLDEAAQLAHFATTTIKRLASEGYFRNSVRLGKPIAFWRDRFVVEVMELDKTRRRIKNSKSQKGGQQK
jgi:hypothetical protein